MMVFLLVAAPFSALAGFCYGGLVCGPASPGDVTRGAWLVGLLGSVGVMVGVLP